MRPRDDEPITPLWLMLVIIVVSAMSSDQAVQANRLQPLQRLSWQWLPPQSQCVGGRCYQIPAHWHRRGQPCTTCGDHTRQSIATPSNQPGTVPLVPLPRQFASPAQPAAPPSSPQTLSSVEPGRLSQDAADQLATIRGELAAGQQQTRQAIDQMQSDQLELLDRADGNTKAIAALAEIVEGVQHVRNASSGDSEQQQWLPSIDWGSVAKWAGIAAGGATGLALPWWAAIAARAGLQYWRNRSTRQSGPRNSPPAVDHQHALEPFVVTTESPPPPQHVVNSQSFVPYATDQYRRAHQQAREQLAKRYPSSIDMLEYEQSLIDQYLSANSEQSK